MTNSTKPSHKCPRTTPLALVLATVLGGASIAQAGLDAGAASKPAYPHGGGTTLPVTSCADDGSPGTLRSVIATAPSGATIDLRALTCSTITLEQGAITLESATVLGPGADLLTIDGNDAGRIFEASSIEIDGLTLTHGRATGDSQVPGNGGCVSAYLDVTLRSSRVVSCNAQGTISANGGGVYATYNVLVENSTVTGNTATASSGPALGGGIASHYQSASVQSSTISGNAAVGHPGLGGGVYALGFTAISLSTIDGNSADRGGGVFCKNSFFGSGSCFVSTSTVSGNTAHDSGGGLVAEHADITFQNSTFAFNVAESGMIGGVLLSQADHWPGNLTSTSTIVANNTAMSAERGQDIDSDSAADDGVIIGGINNLVTSASHLEMRYIIADPELLPLADNGGPTRTHALEPDSPAIDAGTGSNDGTDQRGRARVSGAAADIGAYELQTDAMFADGFDPS